MYLYQIVLIERKKELAISEDQVTKKMANLRSYYCQSRSSYNAAKTKFGSRKPTWIYFDTLKLLDDNLTPKGSSSNVKPSNVSEFKKQKKDASSTKEDEWLENQNMLMSKLINSYEHSESGTSESMEDDLFGQVVAKSIVKIPDGEIKEELKIEIQQLILSTKRILNR